MKHIKDLYKIANELDSVGLTEEADAVDQVANKLISEAGVWEDTKKWVGKKLNLPSMYGEKNSPAAPEEASTPANTQVAGLSLGDKVYTSRAELDAISGNERWIKIDDLIAALESSGRVSKEKIHSFKFNANIDMKTWDRAVDAAVAAGLVSP